MAFEGSAPLDARRAGTPGKIFEAFANLYSEVADALLAQAAGQPYIKAKLGFPDFADGVCGLAFVEGATRSSAAGGIWTTLEPNSNQNHNKLEGCKQ
jgi:hypothetical protein